MVLGVSELLSLDAFFLQTRGLLWGWKHEVLFLEDIKRHKGSIHSGWNLHGFMAPGSIFATVMIYNTGALLNDI